MKNILLLVAGLLSFTAAKAQGPEVSLLTFAGYTFQSSFTTSTSSGKIYDGFQWGGGFEFKMNETKAFEIIYQYMSAGGSVNDYSTAIPKYGTGTAGIAYIMAGGTGYKPVNDKVSLFGTIDLGAAVINPDAATGYSSITKFAWGLRGGIKIATQGKASIRLHAQLMSPVQSFGFGIYAGTGGSGAGASTYSTIYQFSLGGSLNFRLK